MSGCGLSESVGDRNDIAFGVLDGVDDLSDRNLAIPCETGVPHEVMVQHETGAIRSADADGVRYDLISPIFLRGVAETLATGATRYGEHNWRNGFKFSGVINHLIQHIEKYKSGDVSEDHLAHAACNLMFLMEFTKTHPELDDRYKSDGV